MTDFSYPVIAYNTSAERAFAAITHRSDMDVYLGGTGPQSTWSPGDKVLWRSMPGDEFADLDQEVLAVSAPSTVEFTWHTMGTVFDDATPEEDEERTVVRYDIEELDMPGAVKITLTHSGFQSEQSRMYQGISQGWVMILCSLKTFLESEMARSSDNSR